MAKSLLDEMLAGIGTAVNDIREKVVEEPWFGRVVSPDESNTSPLTFGSAKAPDDPNQVHQEVIALEGEILPPSAEPQSQWQEKLQQAREQAPPKALPAPDHDHEPDHEIDR